ncbi:MAG: hypothetical protein ABUL52_00870 [Solimonas sp.]
MTLLPSIALAMCVVYSLHHFIQRHFSVNVVAVIELLLFVVIMVSANTFLKKLRDG